MKFQALLIQITEILKSFVVNNWSIIIAILIAVLVINFFKEGLHLAVTVVFIALVICVLTNMGIMPPLDEIFTSIRTFIQGITQAGPG